MDNTSAGFLNFAPRSDAADQNDQAGTARKLKKDVVVTDAVPVLSRRKLFLYVGPNQNENIGSAVAAELLTRFFSRSPDAIVSFVTGTDAFHTWKRDDFRAALQAGVVKLLAALDLLVIDDGLNYGLTRLIGSAIRSEEEYRTYTSKGSLAGPRQAPINYIGFVPLLQVANADQLISLRGREEGSGLEYVPKLASAIDSGFDINRHHSHYVLLDKSYENIGLLRVEMEKQLQSQMTARDLEGVDDGPDRETEISSVFVPHVVFFFQGGLEELDRIQAYLERRTPVVIMDGCGGMADVLAGGIKSGSEPDEARLRGTLTARLVRAFPELHKSDEQRKGYGDKLFQVVRKAAGLYYIADCSRVDTFGNLDVPLLQAIITSSAEQNASWNQLVQNFKLCVSCNRPEIGSGFLLNSPPWAQLPAKVHYPGMMSALMIPGREAFVDLLMQQRFPLRFLTSHLDILQLFRKAGGRDFFLTLIWDDVLGHNQSDPVREEFVLVELNSLIYSMSGIKNFLDLYELSRVALTQDKDLADPAQAETNALNALIVYAVLLNRPKLVKVLLRYAIDPVPTIVFVEMMYRGMYRSTNNVELRTGLKRQADEFGTMATDILDAGIRESPHRENTFFERTIPAFNYKTTLEMAFDARNRTFISNPLVQNWLDQFGNGFIRVKGGHEELKLLLSAYLIFPMYLWLSFPKPANLPNSDPVAGPKEIDYVYEPKTSEQASGFLHDLKNSQEHQGTSGTMGYKEYYPSLPIMLYKVWSAPIVKYWTWFIIYVMFLIVIGVDMMMPACTNIGLDIAVFILCALIWLELLLRTIHDTIWKRRTDYYLRLTDLIFQTVFIILFFLYRLAPFRYTHPFAGRVILAFGVMYYYYSVWQMFYVFNRQLGPLVRICMIMFKQDLPKWMVMMLPFFISSAVIWQAVITPDYPFTGEDWRRAFYRGTFTLFGAFYNELEYPDQCANQRIDWNNFSQPVDAYPQDRCWLGDYTGYTCQTVSFWSYFFVINYYFFLKLGMVIILVVFYIFRQSVEMPKANIIWRYYRFHTLFEYYWRSSMPFPLNILGNIYLIGTWFKTRKDPLKTAPMDPELTDLKMDTFIYWKSVAAGYFSKKDREEAGRSIPMKQNALLGSVRGGLQSIITRFGDLERKLLDVDENARDTRQRLRQTTNALLRQGSTVVLDIASAAAPEPHIRSRDSPYIGSGVRRLNVPDEKVAWEVSMEHYHPDTYSRSWEEFSAEEREFVDDDRDMQRSASAARMSTNASNASSRSTDWNTIEYIDEDAVNRKTWIVHTQDEPLIYRLDVNGLPLNPYGRTGLRGRGSHCRYGPNHRIILAITTTSNKKTRIIVQMPPGSMATLPNVPLCHYDSEYAVAAILIDAIFNETESSEESDFNPSAVKTETDLTNAIPTLLRKQWELTPANVGKAVPSATVRELYRGYLDTQLNTDHAWMEALVLHVTIPPIRLEATSVYRWKIYSPGLDSGLIDLDAVILRSLHF